MQFDLQTNIKIKILNKGFLVETIASYPMADMRELRDFAKDINEAEKYINCYIREMLKAYYRELQKEL